MRRGYYTIQKDNGKVHAAYTDTKDRVHLNCNYEKDTAGFEEVEGVVTCKTCRKLLRRMYFIKLARVTLNELVWSVIYKGKRVLLKNITHERQSTGWFVRVNLDGKDTFFLFKDLITLFVDGLAVIS